MDIEKIAKAIEGDAGEALPELRQALRKARDIRASRAVGRVTTPEQLLVRSAGAKLGLSQAEFAARIGTPVAKYEATDQAGQAHGEWIGRAAPGAGRARILRTGCANQARSAGLMSTT